MKIQFFENQAQKRKIRKEPSRFALLPDKLSVYRVGREGYIDMRAAVSILMPVARELEAAHHALETFPALTPDTIDIAAQTLTVNPAAKDYRGMIYPGYSAPEMYGGETLGVATDIYAFTAILYFIVTGRAPENAFNRMQDDAPLFSDTLYEEIRNAKSIYIPDLKLEEDPFELDLDAGETMPVIPDDLIDRNFVAILERGMDLDAGERFSSMGDVIVALAPYDTKSAVIYPVLMEVEPDEVHSNLMVTKTVRRKVKKEKPRAEIPPEERTRNFDEEREQRARQKDWTPGWEAEETATQADNFEQAAAERAASMEVLFEGPPVEENSEVKIEETPPAEEAPRAKRRTRKKISTPEDGIEEGTPAETVFAMEATFTGSPANEEIAEREEEAPRAKRGTRKKISMPEDGIEEGTPAETAFAMEVAFAGSPAKEEIAEREKEAPRAKRGTRKKISASEDGIEEGTPAETVFAMEVAFTDAPAVEKIAEREEEAPRAKGEAREKIPEAWDRAGEQTPAERAAAMEALFATLPVAKEEKSIEAEPETQKKKRRSERKPRGEKSQKADPEMAGRPTELLSTVDLPMEMGEAPTEEQILQAAAELDESGDFEGVLSKKEKDEVLNFLLEQLQKSKGDGRGFAEFAEELMTGADDERQNTIRIPERRTDEPLGTPRDAALALFAELDEEPKENTTRVWMPETLDMPRKAAAPKTGRRTNSKERQNPDEAVPPAPKEERFVAEVFNEVEADESNTVNAIVDGTIDKAAESAEEGHREEAKNGFAELFESVVQQSRRSVPSKEPDTDQTTVLQETEEGQQEVVQLAFDQQHPGSITERAASEGKPINLVRLWQKLEQMRNADEEHKDQ